MDIIEYINVKLKDLSQYGKEFKPEEIEQFYQSMVDQNLSNDEMIARIDSVYENVLRNIQKDVLNEKAKNGDYSNFDQVQSVFNYLMDSPVANLIAIYGSAVPYLMTNTTPKRVIGDIDCHCSLENMGQIREFIKQNPGVIKVENDTLDYGSEDYGVELVINGLNVSVFPTVETPEGRITRNFVYRTSLDAIEETATIFYGLHDENELITSNVNGREARFSCPEYVYLQKARAMREKDVIDMEVLQPIINKDKVNYLKSVTKTPATLNKQIIKKTSDEKTL